MNRIMIILAICSALIACKAQQGQPAPAASPTEMPAAVPAPTPAPGPEVPTGDAFASPLPQGVVLRQPYNARMDIAQNNKNGTIGRRTEFEFLDGDASQAMASFAESMAAAGFVSEDGPTNENGVIRQVFRKPGYGAVFARAQEEDAVHHKNALARGFVVAAWPQAD